MSGQNKIAEGHVIAGIIHITHSGNGFFIADDSSIPDIYIGEGYLGAALDGDRVLVCIDNPSGHGIRKFGHIVEIIERHQARFVAVIDEQGMARPEDPKNPFDYKITDSSNIPAPQTKVLLETVVFPGDAAEPAARIVETLGPVGAPTTEIAAILRGFQAPENFPEELKVEARKISHSELTTTGRVDLTELLCYTIDPETARDYDDALSIEKMKNGNWRVGVHIADVSAFVRGGEPLDHEAADRATSIYLPGRVIPMLPEELSNDICSLRPREIRYCKTAFIEFTPAGERKKFSLERTAIKSAFRLSYPQAKKIIEDNAAAQAEVSAELITALKNLHQLAQILRARRLENGSLELHMREMIIQFDAADNAIGIAEVENDFSHQLVEEFMLAANIVVAEWAKQNGLPVLHRVHEPPSDSAIAELAEFLSASGYPFKPPLQRNRLQKIIDKVCGLPEERAINLAVLRSFSQAIYSPRNDAGHFALNFPSYLHFTSPIRRYPDLHLHQMLDRAFAIAGKEKLPAKLRKKVILGENFSLEKLGEHCSGRERRAMKIEEAVKDFRRLEMLARTSDREFSAVVTGIRKFGIFVEIEKYFVEALLPRWQIEQRGFISKEVNPNARGNEARGFHLGQEVRVRIIKINLGERICEMELVGKINKRQPENPND